MYSKISSVAAVNILNFVLTWSRIRPSGSAAQPMKGQTVSAILPLKGRILLRNTAFKRADPALQYCLSKGGSGSAILPLKGRILLRNTALKRADPAPQYCL